MKRRNQTRRCKPARGRCTSAKDGGAIAKNSPCKGCGQWRCRTHCACAGTSNAKGRCGPRPRRSAKATAKLVPSAFVPQGRPAPDSYEVFDDESWQVRALQEIGACSDVVLSSYMFDDTGIQEALLSRLRKNPLTVVRVVVVADSFQKGTCRGQRKMLTSCAMQERRSIWAREESLPRAVTTRRLSFWITEWHMLVAVIGRCIAGAMRSSFSASLAQECGRSQQRL